MFNYFKTLIKRDEKGQGMVEYGLILALVSIVALGALGGIGDGIKGNFEKVVGAVSGGEVIPDVSEGPIYTDEEIDGLVLEGYIPIATPDELDNLRKSEEQVFGQGTKWEGLYTSGLDKKYIQVKDIDLSGIDNFVPIGHTNYTNSFRGIYDGGGYKISDLTVDTGGGNYAGLFGRAFGATLKNIGLVGVNVSGGSNVGGLVGYQYNSSVTNSYATGSVTSTGISVGGLVGGQESSSKVLNSYATGKVTGSGNYTGGLVGWQGGSSITNSYATGSVTGSGSWTGGLVGAQDSSSIENSYATGSVTGSADYTGGLVGRQTGSSTVSNSYATGEVTGGSFVGGLVGDQGSSTVTNSYYDTETTGQSDTGKGIGKTTEDMKKQVTYSGWDFTTIWEITDGQYPTLR